MITIPDPALVVMLGAPGAGKTTWASARFKPTQVLCLDEFRGMVSDDECDQDATDDAAAVLDMVLRARMARQRTTVIDATNARPDVRERLARVAAAHQMPVVAVVLDTPVEVCVARQADRPGPAPGARWGRRVNADTVRRIHAQITADLPTLASRWITEVHVVRQGVSR